MGQSTIITIILTESYLAVQHKESVSCELGVLEIIMSIMTMIMVMMMISTKMMMMTPMKKMYLEQLVSEDGLS